MFANRSCRTVVLGIEETIYTLKKYTARETVIVYDNSADAQLPNLSRETKFSGANADREILTFPVQLTTSRIGNLTRLIHTLATCVTNTYCMLHVEISTGERLSGKMRLKGCKIYWFSFCSFHRLIYMAQNRIGKRFKMC